MRIFMNWMAETHPELETFAQVMPAHALQFAEELRIRSSQRTGKPLALTNVIHILSHVLRFSRDVANWGWDDVPAGPLLQHSDLPKRPERIPRAISDPDLARLMPAIYALTCPYQRTALLIARWSGARRGEIARLPLDCLGTYADGTARLYIPAGKTYQERDIPLHEEAAGAIRALQALRARGDTRERGFRDPKTGVETHYLFVLRGQPLSEHYLFVTALKRACAAAGLLTLAGKPSITAHRFRHTLGTQLAREKARLRSIMAILGHSSPRMTTIYLDITDPEVAEDYRAALVGQMVFAGPAVERLRKANITDDDVDWLNTHFFKSELELGHCLRLPEEGPCECDRVLTCRRFVTTREKAPRLRRRWRIEQALAEDARSHGWDSEVVRHETFSTRCEKLLLALGEPLEGPEASD